MDAKILKNNELFCMSDDGIYITVVFQKKNVLYDEDIAFFDKDFFDVIKCRNIRIKGRCPVEIYAYAVYWCVRNGCKSISIEEFNLGTDLQIYKEGENISDTIPSWCCIKKKNDSVILSVIPSSTLDGKWSKEIIKESSRCFKFCDESKPLFLTGRGSLIFYAVMACSAAVSGCRNVFIDKPTEKSLLKISGSFIPSKNIDGRLGKMIGIIGDPNSGKSVFSRVIGCLVELYGNKSVWVYDCDAAALTSDWYIYGLQQAQSEKDEERIKNVRNSIKQKWSEPLELTVSQNMENTKKCLDFVIADLPGGMHDDEKNIHRRIPDKGRVQMLCNCDSFVIIGRPDRPESIDGWKSALADYNMQEKVVAEILSQNPERTPSVDNSFFDENGIFHATVCGLDRKNPINDIVSAFNSSFKDFAEKILQD